MLKAIFNWFGHKNPSPESQAPAVQPEAAPYKVEVVNSQPLMKEAAPVAEAVKEAKVAKKPAAIKAAPKKAAAKKPAAPAKPAAKKPRAPKKTS
jgi:hypothetical protein